MALILSKKVIVLAKDFADSFSEESANVLPEQTKVNKHTIQLKVGKQQPYGPIFSLGLVEFETLKIYIKSNLANGFIRALLCQGVL